MKKLLICIFLLLTPLSTQGFLGEDLGLDLYKDIDSGIDELEKNTYIYEVVGSSETIKDEINRILVLNKQRPCLSGDISIREFDEIANGDLEILERKIGDQCRDASQNINLGELANIQQTIKSVADSRYLESKKKVTNIYKTARVGLYTNGSKNDSPFDLISDLEAIDTIIFGEPFEYDGQDIHHLSLLEGKQSPKIAASTLSSDASGSSGGSAGSSGINNSSQNQNNQTKPGEDNTQSDDYLDNAGENICIDPSLHGNLSQDSLDAIFGKKTSSQKSNIRQNTANSETSNTSGYSEYRDDENWNCDGFFCVTVEYIVYNHKLLGSSDRFSIKKVIETSNEHLQKFANTSLAQSKMTKNFYELGLILKDLPKMFNMGVVVLEKPVPIINVGDNSATDQNTYGKSNLVEQYYKDRGLEYKKRNSIKNLQKLDAQTVSIINCAELPATCVSDNLQRYNTYVRRSLQESQALQNSLEQVGLYSDNENFFRLFAELDGFIAGLLDYTQKLKPLAKKLADISQVTK